MFSLFEPNIHLRYVPSLKFATTCSSLGSTLVFCYIPILTAPAGAVSDSAQLLLETGNLLGKDRSDRATDFAQHMDTSRSEVSQRLPDEILLIILEACRTLYKHNRRKHKASIIPLSLVCTAWHNFLAPFIYSKVRLAKPGLPEGWCRYLRSIS